MDQTTLPKVVRRPQCLFSQTNTYLLLTLSGVVLLHLPLGSQPRGCSCHPWFRRGENHTSRWSKSRRRTLKSCGMVRTVKCMATTHIPERTWTKRRGTQSSGKRLHISPLDVQNRVVRADMFSLRTKTMRISEGVGANRFARPRFSSERGHGSSQRAVQCSLS